MQVLSPLPIRINPVQIQDPLRTQAMQTQNMLAATQLAQAARGMQSQNAMAKIYSESVNPQTGEIDRNHLINGMASAGLGDRIPEVQAHFAAADKAKLEAKNAQFDYTQKTIKSAYDDVRGATSPDDVVKVIQRHTQAGDLTPEQGTSIIDEMNRYGPDKFNTFKDTFTNRLLTAAEQVKAQHDAATLAETSRYHTGELAINRGRLGVAQGELGVSRGRLALEQQKFATGAGTGAEISPKDIQKREAAYPKATAALNSSVHDLDQQIADVEALRAHPGLSGITGLISGRTPGITGAARGAEARLDKIKAQAGFSALQNMRNNSPTGGALGQVSDAEGKRLENSVAALSRTQDTADFQKSLDKYAADLRFARDNLKNAYVDTYSYRTRGGTVPAAATPKGGTKAVTKSNW